MATSTANPREPNIGDRRLSPDQGRAVAPALEKHAQELLYGEV